MKETGIVRRIDELGRIVIPKEIRKQLLIKEGESISFSMDSDKIVLSKYSYLSKLSSNVQRMLELLYKKYGNVFMLCDLKEKEIKMVDFNNNIFHFTVPVGNHHRYDPTSKIGHADFHSVGVCESVKVCGFPIDFSYEFIACKS